MRYSSTKILTDLKEKMVFIGGPRQVGKTTLSLELIGASSKESPAYFNWDDKSDKKKIRNSELSFEEPLIILDEVHKFKNWNNKLAMEQQFVHALSKLYVLFYIYLVNLRIVL